MPAPGQLFTTPNGGWRNNHDLFGSGPGCYLYRFWDAAGHLLYVGISRNPAERWAKHRQKKAWWPAATLISYMLYPTDYAALCAENEAIRSERPLHNIRVAAA